MFIGLLQIRHAIQDHARLLVFTMFVILTWAVWLLKASISRRYRPWVTPFAASTTVVIPVVDEPLDLFRDVLARIVAHRPSEVIVVINGPRNPDLERVCDEFPSVERTWTSIPGKRNAVRVGVERAHGDIVLLVDSDTIWTEGTLPELLKPFADPRVGGVTTRQRILDSHRGFLLRWADWIENSRALYSMPAQSVLGCVGCLPGRTIAFRRSVLVDVMHDFMHARFLGVFLEVSDDRTLTNLTLKAGYRTVYQSTSLVYTDAPTRIKKLVKQQFRWARGSQYNTLRMLPWMVRHTPLLAFFFVSDIALPFLWLISAISWVVRSFRHNSDNLYEGLLHTGRTHSVAAIVLLTLVTSTLSMCLRQHRHLAEVPEDVWWMPVYILFSTLVLMPIRLYGFVRLGHAGGWGTRANAYSGAADDAENADTDAEPVLQPVAVSVDSGGGSAETVAEPLAIGAWSSQELQSPVQQARRRSIPVRSRRTARLRKLNPLAGIPYLLAGSIMIAGVIYDIRPV
jgi:hyaluronan synthase